MKCYKIRSKSKGTFSDQRMCNSRWWGKTGKIWIAFGRLAARLHVYKQDLDDMNQRKEMEDWEIVEYEMVEKRTIDFVEELEKLVKRG